MSTWKPGRRPEFALIKVGDLRFHIPTGVLGKRTRQEFKRWLSRRKA